MVSATSTTLWRSFLLIVNIPNLAKLKEKEKAQPKIKIKDEKENKGSGMNIQILGFGKDTWGNYKPQGGNMPTN